MANHFRLRHEANLHVTIFVVHAVQLNTDNDLHYGGLNTQNYHKRKPVN